MLSDRTILYSFKLSAFLNVTTIQHLPNERTDRTAFHNPTEFFNVPAEDSRWFRVHSHQNNIPVMQSIAFLAAMCLRCVD